MYSNQKLSAQNKVECSMIGWMYAGMVSKVARSDNEKQSQRSCESA